MAVATKTKPVLKKKPFFPEPNKKDILLQEFELLRVRSGGVLRAEDVVEEAENKSSPLHSYFQWDDTEAARQYRIWQARQLISAVVVLLPNAKRTISAYVSLRDDRMNPGGGYLAIASVLTNADQRERFLYEALEDLRTWERKYRQLAELAEIYSAIETVRSKVRKKKK